MLKYVLAFFLGLAALMLAGCETPETEGRRPERSPSAGELPWARPASWEGGLPGMPINNQPRQY